MAKKIKLADVIMTVFILVTTLVVVYGGVGLWREWKRTSQKSEIRTDLEPLKQELLELKNRVSALEEKSRQEKEEK